MDANAIINNRYDGLLIIEGTMINPNGDPDNEGSPRVDPLTGHGLVSHASINRRIRDLAAERFGVPIHIVRGRSIEESTTIAATEAGLDINGTDPTEEEETPKKKGKKVAAKKTVTNNKASVTSAVCARYWDVRMMGGVLGVGKIRGESVSGAVTVTTGKSIYPVEVAMQAGTRVCETNVDQDKDQEMLRRHYVLHGVYALPFFINPHHAKKNGATMKDLAIYLDCMAHAYDRRSSMSGVINIRDLVLFQHESPLGNAPSYRLFESYKITCDNPTMARSWTDYNVSFDPSALPKGIRVLRLSDFETSNEKILRVLSGKGA